MKKFTVKEIKDAFVKEQVESNRAMVVKSLTENKNMFHQFMEFSTKQGFAIKEEKSLSPVDFKFVVYLVDESNAQSPANKGEIVFEKKDFAQGLHDIPEVLAPATVVIALPALTKAKKEKKVLEKDSAPVVEEESKKETLE